MELAHCGSYWNWTDPFLVKSFAVAVCTPFGVKNVTLIVAYAGPEKLCAYVINERNRKELCGRTSERMDLERKIKEQNG